jgi:carbon-monoxide dehydrogenase large subunit
LDRQVSQGRSEGASVRRLEDRRFLNGGGEYLADMQRPGMVEAAFLRSPIAHGRIAAVGIPDQYRDRVFLARDLPPVKPIVADSAAKGFKHSEYPPLAGKKVRFVGEMVAVCLGPTRAEAEDIAQACTLEIDELPALWDIDIALASDAPRVHDSWPDNIFVETRIETGDLAALKHQAPVIVKRQLRMGRHAGVPMEGRGVLAHYDRRLDELVVHSSTQFPHVIRTILAQSLGIAESKLRVVAPRNSAKLSTISSQISCPRSRESCGSQRRRIARTHCLLR